MTDKPSPVLSKEWIESARDYWWPLNAGSYHTVPDPEFQALLNSHEALRQQNETLRLQIKGLKEKLRRNDPTKFGTLTGINLDG